MRATLAGDTRYERKITGPSKGQAIKKFPSVRQYTEYICEPLAIEDYVIQPAAFVSPPKWHLGHTTWFFEEFILIPHYPNYTRFHPQYALLFDTWYENADRGPRKQPRGSRSRPTVEEIFQYRAYVDEHMNWLLQDFPEEAIPLLETGIQHEQKHQELLYADIKFILAQNATLPPYKTEVRETPHIEREHHFISIPEGRYSIGHRGKGFAWDNEAGHHVVFLRPFSIRNSLVTNHEYLQFIHDRGYQRPEYWHSDGWDWVKRYQIGNPLYWSLRDGIWCRYSLSGLERLHHEEPVTHISFYEASAFAQWKGQRLPTEFEWEAAAGHFSWGLRWEHTNSAYLPYPGYTRPVVAPGDYDQKFMINAMVLRGSSPVTPEHHSRRTYRNFFHPGLRWQFNGIRLCEK